MNEVLMFAFAGALAVVALFFANEAAGKWRRARHRLRMARQRTPEHRLAGITEQTVAAMVHEARAAFERTHRHR